MKKKKSSDENFCLSQQVLYRNKRMETFSRARKSFFSGLLLDSAFALIFSLKGIKKSLFGEDFGRFSVSQNFNKFHINTRIPASLNGKICFDIINLNNR